MPELARRDFLTMLLASLFLALFPWLRGSDEGIEVARATAAGMLEDPGLKFDVEAAMAILKARYPQRPIAKLWFAAPNLRKRAHV